jgi:hypothetical protein
VYGFSGKFGWRVHLIGLPPDAVLEEQRQRLAYKARTQLGWSQKGRASATEHFEEIRKFRHGVEERAEAESEAKRMERLGRIDHIWREKGQTTGVETRIRWVGRLVGGIPGGNTILVSCLALFYCTVQGE